MWEIEVCFPTDSPWQLHFCYNRRGHGKQASTKMCSFFQMYLGCGPFSVVISAKARWTELMCVHLLPKVLKWLSLSFLLSSSPASCSHERSSNQVNCKRDEDLILIPHENNHHPGTRNIHFELIWANTINLLHLNSSHALGVLFIAVLFIAVYFFCPLLHMRRYNSVREVGVPREVGCEGI